MTGLWHVHGILMTDRQKERMPAHIRIEKVGGMGLWRRNHEITALVDGVLLVFFEDELGHSSAIRLYQ